MTLELTFHSLPSGLKLTLSALDLKHLSLQPKDGLLTRMKLREEPKEGEI